MDAKDECKGGLTEIDGLAGTREIPRHQRRGRETIRGPAPPRLVVTLFANSVNDRNLGFLEKVLAGRTFVQFYTIQGLIERVLGVYLRAWSFPELDRVVYDTKTEDIVISAKPRKDNGKGYRAITYAAFMIGVLQETNRKHLPHPGFVLLDSPLVTYREPDEHIGEGVKYAFYRQLASILSDAQVIILENEEPPEDLKGAIAFTAFTKNRTVGRYGLFPPLPDDSEQEMGPPV